MGDTKRSDISNLLAGDRDAVHVRPSGLHILGLGYLVDEEVRFRLSHRTCSYSFNIHAQTGSILYAQLYSCKHTFRCLD